MDWLISLITALATTPNPATGLTVDEDPYVEMAFTAETGVGADAGDSTYSAAASVAQFKRLITAWNSVMPHTILSVQNNFCGNSQLTQDLTNFIYASGVGQGGPDTILPGQKSSNPFGYTWGQAAALGVASGDPDFTGPDLRGKIAMTSCTEGPELSNATRYKMYTPMSFFNFVNDQLRQAHWIPNCIKSNVSDDPIPAYPATGLNTGANPGNWHSIMQVINGQTLTHTAKPTSIP
jgi:hypothetical protein